MQYDDHFRRAALTGYQAELAQVNERIAELQHQLGKTPTVQQLHKRLGRPPKASISEAKAEPPKRHMSAAARRRIGAATRRRWAEYRRQKAAAEKAMHA